MFFNLNGWRQCRIALADRMECCPLVEALGVGQDYRRREHDLASSLDLERWKGVTRALRRAVADVRVWMRTGSAR